ncbi:hypothetical protein LSM04_000406 [Trypanosoma melophagium]|uniref:uncharacterized protein n=1 Tax=Trypanosoma melophagium TaxID=715481 RepID=UPI003519F55A|nr:hypothetical protein LSM04_000406 [Trypanosoma melophagium]
MLDLLIACGERSVESNKCSEFTSLLLLSRLLNETSEKNEQKQKRQQCNEEKLKMEEVSVFTSPTCEVVQNNTEPQLPSLSTPPSSAASTATFIVANSRSGSGGTSIAVLASQSAATQTTSMESSKGVLEFLTTASSDDTCSAFPTLRFLGALLHNDTAIIPPSSSSSPNNSNNNDNNNNNNNNNTNNSSTAAAVAIIGSSSSASISMEMDPPILEHTMRASTHWSSPIPKTSTKTNKTVVTTGTTTDNTTTNTTTNTTNTTTTTTTTNTTIGAVNGVPQISTTRPVSAPGGDSLNARVSYAARYLERLHFRSPVVVRPPSYSHSADDNGSEQSVELSQLMRCYRNLAELPPSHPVSRAWMNGTGLGKGTRTRTSRRTRAAAVAEAARKTEELSACGSTNFGNTISSSNSKRTHRNNLHTDVSGMAVRVSSAPVKESPYKLRRGHVRNIWDIRQKVVEPRQNYEQEREKHSYLYPYMPQQQQQQQQQKEQAYHNNPSSSLIIEGRAMPIPSRAPPTVLVKHLRRGKVFTG